MIGATTFGTVHALGATETIASSPGCCTFAKPTFTIDPGQVATFQNPGDVSHDVAASGKGPDGEGLFRSDIISSGQTPVNGTQYLAAGSYPFSCSIHPEMRAELAVTANGSPVARPDIEVKVLSSKIHKVVRTLRLKVKVSAATESEDVALTPMKGLLKLGKTKSGIDLAAGSSRTVKLNVSPGVTAGFIADRFAKVKVKVTGDVPFGSPARARRTLR